MWSQLRNAGRWRREPSGALRGGRARLVAAVVLSMTVVAWTAAVTASAAAAGGDSPAVTIRFWPHDYTAVEGADPAMVTLALSEPLDRRLEVPVTWTLAANLGPGEFFPLSELVVFEAGETSKSFAVTAVHDGVAESLEFVIFGVIEDLPSDVHLVHPTYAIFIGTGRAEGVGFEPTEALASHAFQACPFGRSGNPPRSRAAGPDTRGYRVRTSARFGV